MLLSDHDREHRGQLMNTLRTYLRVGDSLKETARVLYRHVNTVRRWLRRVAELTGRDPLVLALAIGLLTFDRKRATAWARVSEQRFGPVVDLPDIKDPNATVTVPSPNWTSMPAS